MPTKYSNRWISGRFLFVATVLVILLTIVLGFTAQETQAKSYTPPLAELNGLFSCIFQEGIAPAQDGEFPPEGYHCRSAGENGTDFSAGSSVRKVRKSQDDSTSYSSPVLPEATATPDSKDTVPQATDVPEESEKECKNKNDGKDGNVGDCNAGGGND